jgi:hypothetical protein
VHKGKSRKKREEFPTGLPFELLGGYNSYTGLFPVQIPGLDELAPDRTAPHSRLLAIPKARSAGIVKSRHRFLAC